MAIPPIRYFRPGLMTALGLGVGGVAAGLRTPGIGGVLVVVLSVVAAIGVAVGDLVIDREAIPDREVAWSKAVDLFGEEGARGWLKQPQPGLDDQKPVAVWHRADEARRVRKLLERMEHLTFPG